MVDRKGAFESDFAPAGDGTAVAWVRRESPRRTAIFAGNETGEGGWRRLDAPGPVHDLAARGPRLWLLTDDAVHESLDHGQRFTALPLPGGAASRTMTQGPDGPLVASATEVLGREGDEWVVRWVLPTTTTDQRISSLRIASSNPGAGFELLVGTNRAQMFRGRPGESALEEYSQGLPPPLTGGAFQTPGMNVVDDWRFAYVGGLYARRPEHDTWSQFQAIAPPELASVAAVDAGGWVRAPWADDVWIGAGVIAVLEAGPGRAERPLWQAPQPGLHYVKDFRVGARRVMAGFHWATPALAGLSLREGGAVDPIALPVE